MNYYVTESFDDPQYKCLGGTKAREDVESILQSMGMTSLNMKLTERKPKGFFGKIAHHFVVKRKWDQLFDNLKKDDSVVLQYVLLEHSLFFYQSIKRIIKRGVNVIIVVHDLESLQIDAFNSYSFFRRKRIEMEEQGLRYANKIIVHNDRMKGILLERGFSLKRIVVLGIFDYLLPNIVPEQLDNKDLELTLPIIISGNLSPNKSKYVYSLPDNIDFNLYGVNFKGKSEANITYHGAFDPDEIPLVMSGSFGLVWDGESCETCTGRFGEYLKINNPHKTSLYLVSGIPVAICSKAALAQFVLDNQCGVVIDSIEDLFAIQNNTSENDYDGYLKNARIVSSKLREGYFMREAIKKALQ